MNDTVPRIREELADLADVIESLEARIEGTDEPFAWQLSLDGLQVRRDQLVSQLEEELARAQAAEVAVSVAGDPVKGAEIDSRFLGEYLVRMQKLVSAIGQAMATRPTRRGSLSQDIIGRTQLRLAAVSAGSFVATLTGTPAPNLFGESLIEDAISELHELLDTADNADQLAHRFAQLGARAQAHYGSFIEHLASSGASVTIESLGTTEGLRRTVVSEARAQDVRTALELLEREEERQESLLGRLIGVRQEHGDFEFLDENTGDIVTGKIGPDTMADAVNCFNQLVMAVFAVEVVSVRGADQMTETWELLRVMEAPEQFMP